jgi:hypothetical protein
MTEPSTDLREHFFGVCVTFISNSIDSDGGSGSASGSTGAAAAALLSSMCLRQSATPFSSAPILASATSNWISLAA